MKKSVRQISMLLLLMIAAGSVSASGGDWKMGPFGPYWEDNDWPEFTPMYWMEEFMNRLDDDDDEIQTWMLMNQFPGQYSGAWPGTGLRGTYPQYGMQPDTWTGSRAQSMDRRYAAPNSNARGGNTYIIGENNPLPDASDSEPGPLPYLTPEEFARMPVELQIEYKRAFDKEYPIVSKPKPDTERRPLPKLTAQEYARMPVELQREYKRAFNREYYSSSSQEPRRESRRLPKLSSEEFASMPRELQRDYKRAFEREYMEPPRRPPYGELGSLPNLTPEEFASMPPELQRDYKRAFDQEYSAFKARQAREREDRLGRRSYARERRSSN